MRIKYRSFHWENNLSLCCHNRPFRTAVDLVSSPSKSRSSSSNLLCKKRKENGKTFFVNTYVNIFDYNIYYSTQAGAFKSVERDIYFSTSEYHFRVQLWLKYCMYFMICSVKLAILQCIDSKIIFKIDGDLNTSIAIITYTVLLIKIYAL